MQPPPSRPLQGVVRRGGTAPRRDNPRLQRGSARRCSSEGTAPVEQPPPAARGSAALPAAAAACAVLAAAVAVSWPQYDASPLRGPPHDTSELPVTIVIPALNEEESIESCLRCVNALRPPPAAVIVSVGPSTDRTAALAHAYGARVVSGEKGRARLPARRSLLALHTHARSRHSCLRRCR
jgi:Glycosyl transferase family 2